MKIAICDDIASERALIAGHVSDYFPEAFLLEYADGEALIAAHLIHQFDLIFLDMLMPTINGIKTAEEIRKFDEKIPIIFVTATEAFAVQSYLVFALDYIIKPVTSQNMKRCLSRFSMQKRGNRLLSVNYLGVSTDILLDNIVYLESNLRKVIFHLSDDKLITITAKLDDYFKVLGHREFCRCHKSFVVNLGYVSSISGEDFLLTNGEYMRISRTFFSEAKKAYFDYVFSGGDGV